MSRRTVASPPALGKATLPNGLRVLAVRRPGAPQVTVCVHYGVGFRCEPPGREGLAHLFEHLMFRGSESLPDGRFYDHVLSLGGQANGTTHQDYTDYYQTVPAAALEQALFSEADRMRAPRFTPQSLAQQLDGIELELREKVTERPYGGFPWPLMAGVRFRRHPNAHDGYGCLDQLRQVTVDDCAEFFDAYYTPGNAVLTVAGDTDPERVLALAERWFGDIPARPAAPTPRLEEPEPAGDRCLRRTSAMAPLTAVAIGCRVPNPLTDLRGYLAHAVLAHALEEPDPADPAAPAIAASCGFFGPLDARDPDVLIVASLVPPAVGPDRVLAVLRHRCDRLAAASEQAAGAVERAVRRSVTQHHRQHSDLEAACRARGRLELLFGRAELLDELPGQLAAVSLAEVAAAARAVQSAPKAILIVEPGPARAGTRLRLRAPAQPAQEAPGTPRPHRRAEQLARSPGGPRTAPPLGAQPRLRIGAFHSTTLQNGLRVIGVADRHVPLVELRLRLPMGVAAWQRPGQVGSLLRWLGERARAAGRARQLGGAFQLATDGQWMDATGYAPPSEVAGWLAILADVVSPTALDAGPPALDGAPPGSPSAQHALDSALRRRWLGSQLAGAGDRPAPDRLRDLHRCAVNPRGGVLLAVGDLEPLAFTAQAELALGSWPAGNGDGAALPAPPAAGELLVLYEQGRREVAFMLCALEPERGAEEAARYLATAVVGGYHRSRLITRSARAAAYEVLTGRDTFLGFRRAYVRASARNEVAADAFAEVQEELEGLAAHPPSGAEVDTARRYCAAQLLSAFTSPAVTADLLCRMVASGRDVTWPYQLPELLSRVPETAVAEAALELFAPGALTTVVLMDADAPLALPGHGRLG